MQVSAQRQPFAFASSYPALMPPQATANPMYSQTPQDYFMPPMKPMASMDVVAGTPLAVPYLGAAPGHGHMAGLNPLLQAVAAAEPLTAINTPHPLGQDATGARQPQRRKHSHEAGSGDDQNQQHNV